MSKLIRSLAPGETLVLDEAFVNELVTRLDAKDAPGPFTVASTSPRAIVHFDDDVAGVAYPLNPPSVYVSDKTNWGGFDPDQVVVTWTLTGPGHLVNPYDASAIGSTVRTGASDLVEWTWSASGEITATGYTWRTWSATVDGAALPATAVVSGQARVLTNEVDGTHVTTETALGALGSPTDGERRYVLATDSVYTFTSGAPSGDVAGDGGYWDATAAPTWAVYGSHASVVSVERAYDPDYTSTSRADVEADRTQAYLDGGSAEYAFEDRSGFPSATSAARTLTVTYTDGSTDGLTIVDPLGAGDWLAASPAGRAFSVLATRPGDVVVEASYSLVTPSGAETRTARRRVTVWAGSKSSTRVAGPPSLPPAVSVVPGNGQTSVVVGLPVDVWTVSEVQSLDTAPMPFAVARPKPAFRLPTALPKTTTEASGTVAMDRTEAQGLAAAAAYVQTVLARQDLSGARTYEVVLSSNGAALPAAALGSVVYAGGVVGQLTSLVASGKRTSTYQMRGTVGKTALSLAGGALPTTPIATGHLSAAADLVALHLEFGYGTPGSASFPHTAFDHYSAVDPDSGLSTVSVTLPTARPQEVTDAWHVRVKTAASWDGEPPVVSQGDWTPAEVVPSGAVGVTLTALDGTADAYVAEISGGDDYEFYGSTGWEVKAPKFQAVDMGAALTAGALPRRQTTLVPAQYYTGADFVVRGHFRARGGSCQPTVVTARSQRVTPTGLPLITSTLQEDLPSMAAPDGVVFLSTPSGAFCSVGGAWLRLGGTVVPRAQTVTVTEPGGSAIAAVKTGYNAFAHTVPVGLARTSPLVTNVVFEGGVKTARVLSGPASSTSFSDQALEIRTPIPAGGLSTSTIVIAATPHTGEEFMVTLHLTVALDTAGQGPTLYELVATDTNNATQLQTAEEADPDRPGFNRWRVSYSAGVTLGDLTVALTFEDPDGVGSAYVLTGSGLVATQSYDTASRTLTVTTSGLSGDNTIGIVPVDALGQAGSEVRVFFSELP
jgi:hypothetical protein